MTGEILVLLEKARDAIDEVGELPWQQRAEIRPLLVEAPSPGFAGSGLTDRPKDRRDGLLRVRPLG